MRPTETPAKVRDTGPTCFYYDSKFKICVADRKRSARLFKGPFTPEFLRLELLRQLFLNNGLDCSKWVHSHMLFGRLLCRLKSSIMGCVPILRDYTD